MNNYIDEEVVIEDGAIVYPNVVIEGKSVIKKGSKIYMNSYIKDSVIGEDTIVYSSYIFESNIGKNNIIGPFSNIRKGTTTKDNIKIGAFVEIKNSIIDNETKIPHLAYVGDSEIGKKVHIGCGAITANFDGKNKHKTIIKDEAFIGCNSNLVAPLIIERKAFVAAGSTITKNVSENSLAIARERQINKEEYVKE